MLARIVLLIILFCVGRTSNANEQGFVPLFDGESLSGWMKDGPSFVVDYVVKDGALVCKPAAKSRLFTEKQYGDFVLRFEFQLTPGANNGLGIRTPLNGDPAYLGIELQILDNSAEKYNELEPYQFHASAYGIAPAKKGFLKPVGEWNTQEVRCFGRKITVVLNDETVLDIDLDQVAPNGKTIDGKDHPGLNRSKGHIGILGHGDQVSFRNIRIRELTGRRLQHLDRVKKPQHRHKP